EGEHLMVEGKKMSKSLGNIYTLKDLEKRGHEPMDFRYFVLGAHYRKPLNFTWKALAAARQGRLGLENSLDRIRRGPSAGRRSGRLKDENEALKVIAACEKQFREAIEDDLNTPQALAILNELLHYANILIERELLTKRTAAIIRAAALEFDRVLGLNLKRHRGLKVPPRVMKLVEKREDLRKAKKWREADRIRNQIRKLGYVVEDTPTGPHLHPTSS
ncbi:MAG: DALR domain-containing protein, partial [Patescibacteria group bacterium]